METATLYRPVVRRMNAYHLLGRMYRIGGCVPRVSRVSAYDPDVDVISLHVFRSVAPFDGTYELIKVPRAWMRHLEED